jgi:ribosome-binding protein aMBF1 (putative translation factor)
MFLSTWSAYPLAPGATQLGFLFKSIWLGRAGKRLSGWPKSLSRAEKALRFSLWIVRSERDSISGTLGSSDEKRFHHHGRAIRHFREAAGLTQEELAHAIGGHFSDISRLESGDANPTYSTLAKVAAGLGVSVSRILSLGEAYAEAKQRSEEERSAVLRGLG